MKKIIYLLLISLVIFSCKKNKVEDEVPQLQVNDQSQEKIGELNSKLLSSKNGWYADYEYNKEKKTVLLYFNFKNKNKVSIQSPIKGYESKESGYTLFYEGQVNLLFDKNNVFVKEFNRTDLKWQLVAIKENEIIFKNNKEEESTLVLKKSDGSHSAIIKDIIKAQANLIIARDNLITNLSHDPAESYFRNLEIKGVNRRYAFSFDEENFSLSFVSENAEGKREKHISQISIVSEGKFSLKTPLIVNGKEIKDFSYDSTNKKFIIENSSLKGEIIYGSKVLTYKGAADAFLTPRKTNLIQTQPSLKFKPFVDAIFNIKGVAQIQWYVFTKDVSRDGINIFIKDGNNKRWIGNDVATRMQKGGEDIIIVPRAGNTDLSGAFSGDSKKAIDDHFLLCSESEGFYVINNQKRNSKGEETYTLVSKKSPNIFFKLTENR